VPIIPIIFSGDQKAFEEAMSPDHPCAVLDAFGGGPVPERFIPVIRAALERYPVIFASRCAQGVTLEQTYGFPGSERDLRLAGAIPARVLDTIKARILAALLIASGISGDRFGRTFRTYVSPSEIRE
jgi:L-asparaginase